MSGWNGIFYNGVWSCGFDFLPNGAVAAGGVFGSQNGSNVGSSYARFSGKGVQISGNATYLGRTLGVNLASMYAGFAFEAVALPAGGVENILASFYDATAGAGQFSLAYNSSGQLGIYVGGGLPGYGLTGLMSGTTLSAAGVIIAGSYCYIEVFCTISATVGVITVNVNGVTVLNFSGINTKTTANAYVNAVYIGASTSSGANCNHYFDDMYMLDTTGAAPLNTFLGPGRIQTDGPNADSATSGLNQWSWTTPTGTDYGNCANIPANSGDYNYDSTVGDRMSFRFPGLTTAKVFFLNTWYSAQEDAAGTRTIVPIFRNNSADQVGPSPNSLAVGYTYYNQPSTIDPNTGNPWSSGTVAAAAACEIGLKVNS